MFAEFLTLVPETNQFHETLNKIFRKKIKRAKVSEILHEHSVMFIQSHICGSTQQKQRPSRTLISSGVVGRFDTVSLKWFANRNSKWTRAASLRRQTANTNFER